jgi:hypothetical protein
MGRMGEMGEQGDDEHGRRRESGSGNLAMSK